MRRRRVLCWAWWVAAVVVCVAASSQAADEPALRGGGGVAGGGQYRAGRWGVVTTTVSNPRDTAADLAVGIWFTASPGAQFVASVWLPPRSMRQVWLPVFVPHVPPPQAPSRQQPDATRAGVSLATEAVLLDLSVSPARQIARQQGALIAANDPVLSAMLADASDLASIHAAVAMRTAVGLKPRMSYLKAQSLPAVAAGWDAIDTLTISTDQPDLDSAQIDALRGWLVAGGRLWLMLDEVQPDFAARLLGDDWCVEVVDRVALPVFTVEGGEQPSVKAFDEPVDLVRVVATGFQVTHTVNGWPAAMRRRVGNGSLLITTLGPRAWLNETDDNPGSGGRSADTPLRALSRWFNDVHGRARPEPIDALHSYASGQVERRVVGRSFVAATLGGFCACLLGAGLLLARRQRLAYVAPIGAVMSIAIAGVLVGVGARNRQATPATVADVALVHVAPGQRVAAVNGLVSLYSPRAQDAQLTGEAGAVVFPAQDAGAGRVARMTWTDFDRWRWQGLDAPGGVVTRLVFQQAATIDEPLRATLRFTENGVEGDVRVGPLGPMQDGVIATGGGAFPVRLHGDGSFTASAEGRQAHGQLIDAVAMTDEQQRRQRVFGALIDQPGFPRGPTLLAWSAGIALGWNAMPNAQRTGAALVALPLAFERPHPGDRLAVPPAFVRFENLFAGRFKGGMGIYNESLGKWNEMARGGPVYLRFTLPAELLPLRVESARLTMDAQLAGRTLGVAIVREGEQAAQSPARQGGAHGPIAIDLPVDPPLLADGRADIELALHVSELADPTGLQTWKLENVQLHVVGVAQPR